jgi:hypothetical protein
MSVWFQSFPHLATAVMSPTEAPGSSLTLNRSLYCASRHQAFPAPSHVGGGSATGKARAFKPRERGAVRCLVQRKTAGLFDNRNRMFRKSDVSRDSMLRPKLRHHSGASHQRRTRNLEIPGSMREPVIGPRIARTRWHRPGMTS